MNKTKTLILVQMLFGVVCFILLWKYTSWSASDGSPMEPALKAGLSAIILSVFALSFTHKQASKIMFENTWKIPFIIRLRHLDRLTAYLFVGVLAFGVNEYKFWHFFFIILAAAGMFLRAVNYYEDKLYRKLATIAMIAVSSIWVVAFILPFLIPVGVAELLFYMVCAFIIISQLKEIE